MLFRKGKDILKKLTFIQIGDLHYSAMGNAVEELKDAINKDLNDNIKNEYNIDFILFSGDLVNGSKLSTTKENRPEESWPVQLPISRYGNSS